MTVRARDDYGPCPNRLESADVKLRGLLVPEHLKEALDLLCSGGHGYAAVFDISNDGVCLLEESCGERPSSDLRETAQAAAQRVSETHDPLVSHASDGTAAAAHPVWLYDGGRCGYLKGCLVLSPPPALGADSAWAAALAKFAADQISERISALFALIVERARKDDARAGSSEVAPEVARYERLLNLSTDLMLIADRRLTVLAVNRGAAARMGYDVSELVGQNVLSFTRESERHLAKFLAAQARLTGMSAGRFHVARKDGSSVPSDVFISYDRDAGIYCVIRRSVPDTHHADSELVERARQLETQNAEVRAAMKERDRFLRMVSHELRAPVTSIIGFAELALDDQDTEPDPAQRLALERISDNARRLLDMLNDLLDLSKLEAGKAQLRLSRINLSDSLKQVVENMRPLTNGKEVALELDLASDLPPVTTDEQKLSQIMVNLISNALKFTDKGEVRVSARRNGVSVRVTVSDTGQGIPPDELPHVFREFYQGSRQTRGPKGTGLGLTIARKLAGLLGGEIDVESREGEGSAFTVTLPISPHLSREVGE